MSGTLLALAGLVLLGPPEVELERLRAALEREPEDVELRHAFAGQAIEAGRLVEAEKALREVLRRAPDRLDAALDLAMLLLDTRRTEQALPLLERVVEAAPADEDALSGLVSALIDLGRPTDALLRLQQPSDRLLPLRAFAQLRAGNTAKALDDIGTCLERRPDEWPLRVLAAVAFAVGGRLEAADREVDLAAERAPATAANVPYARAFVAFLRGNVTLAQRSMAEARAKAPGAFEPASTSFTPMAFATSDEVIFLDWASKLPDGPLLRTPALELTMGRASPAKTLSCTRATVMAAVLESPERLARCEATRVPFTLTARGLDARGAAGRCLEAATATARPPLPDGVTCRAALTLQSSP